VQDLAYVLVMFDSQYCYW